MAPADVCRWHGISLTTFYKWTSKYGGLEVSEARQSGFQLDRNVSVRRTGGRASDLCRWLATVLAGDTNGDGLAGFETGFANAPVHCNQPGPVLRRRQPLRRPGQRGQSPSGLRLLITRERWLREIDHSMSGRRGSRAMACPCVVTGIFAVNSSSRPLRGTMST